MNGPSSVDWGAVIVAAGRSDRFGAEDKILADLCGKPVIEWSIRALLSDDRVRALVVVTSQDNLSAVHDIVEPWAARVSAVVCVGGDTRSSSVRAGLSALPDEVTHVAVHDGARPLVNDELVSRILDAAETSGAAVPGVQPASTVGTVSRSADRLSGHLDRSRVRDIQTPQAAGRAVLEDALRRFPEETDESTALVRAGYDVRLVDGSRANLKITVPEDLVLAKALIARKLVRN